MTDYLILHHLLNLGRRVIHYIYPGPPADEGKAMKSGIYARFGTENKDVVTEATAPEFRDWLAIKGLNIIFISDGTLNGEFMGERVPFLQWEIRAAFIVDAEAKGVTTYRVKEDWEAFTEAYEQEAKRRYG